MDKERILSAMGHVEADLIEEADGPVSRPGREWKKPALIAACLCLVLAGAAAGFSGIRLHLTNGAYGGASFEAELTPYSMDRFSQQVREAAAGMGDDDYRVVSALDTWASAGEWLGVPLAESAALAAPWPDVMRLYDTGAKCFTSVWMDSVQAGKPCRIYVRASYLVRDVTVELEARILTEHASGTGMTSGMSFGMETRLEESETRTGSGLEVAVARGRLYRQGDSQPVTLASFRQDGILYTLYLKDVGLERQEAVLEEILAGF